LERDAKDVRIEKAGEGEKMVGGSLDCRPGLPGGTTVQLLRSGGRGWWVLEGEMVKVEMHLFGRWRVVTVVGFIVGTKCLDV
jgi:hypothetical protein